MHSFSMKMKILRMKNFIITVCRIRINQTLIPNHLFKISMINSTAWFYDLNHLKFEFSNTFSDQRQILTLVFPN